MEDSNRPDKMTDDVASLVRLAGESTISVERMERVRAVARQRWREQTRRGSRKPLYWSLAAAMAAIATAVILFGLPGGLFRAPAIEFATIEGLSGGVTLRGSSHSTDLAVGAPVALDSVVETDHDGAVALRLPAGHSLRLDRASAIELRADRSVALVAGALYIESNPLLPRRPIDVRTDFGLIRETGTQFELRLTPNGLRIRLREGAVRLERPGADYTVEAGTEFSLDASGQTQTLPIAAYGHEWDWVNAIAPLPELAGRSAHDFLTWVAREKGWSLAFDDENALRAAQSAIVEGRLERLTPQQALDAVLPASRLAYRIVDGALVVSARP